MLREQSIESSVGCCCGAGHKQCSVWSVIVSR